MPRKIHGAVRVGDETFVAGDESKFAKKIGAKDGISTEDVERLENVSDEEGGPVVSGFGARKGGATEDGEELPKVSDLPEVLAGIDDIEEVRDMAAADDRSTAKSAYNARIAELSQ